MQANHLDGAINYREFYQYAFYIRLLE